MDQLRLKLTQSPTRVGVEVGTELGKSKKARAKRAKRQGEKGSVRKGSVRKGRAKKEGLEKAGKKAGGRVENAGRIIECSIVVYTNGKSKGMKGSPEKGRLKRAGGKGRAE